MHRWPRPYWPALQREELGIWSEGFEKCTSETYQTFLGGGFKHLYIRYVHPYLGKWSQLTHIFQMGWNHQLDLIYPPWNWQWVYTWKWMVGIRSFPFRMASWQVRTVSFREGNCFCVLIWFLWYGTLWIIDYQVWTWCIYMNYDDPH